MWWVGLGSNFFGSLISESDWVSSLSDQPMVCRARSGHVAYFDSCRWWAESGLAKVESSWLGLKVMSSQPVLMGEPSQSWTK